MLTDKEVKKMLQDYYSIKDNKIPKTTKEIVNMSKEIDIVIESLALTSQKLDGLPHGNGVSKPVERIAEESEKIKNQYEERLLQIKEKLRAYNKKIKIYEEWLNKAGLTDYENELVKLMYIDGLRDWRIAQEIHCGRTSVWNYRRSALNKLKNAVE